jgi:ribosomal protein S18 acetylase RimI-like enzyme
VKIRAYQPSDEAAVIGLWEACGLIRPWNDPREDIARKLAEQPELFLVGTAEDELVASAMAGYDGHRGWVYYFAVAPGHREQAFGRMLMQEVERRCGRALRQARVCAGRCRQPGAAADSG